jgi:hypothetical protein
LPDLIQLNECREIGTRQTNSQHVQPDISTGMKVQAADLWICAVLETLYERFWQSMNLLPSTLKKIITVERAIWKYNPVCSLRELIMDHGTEFGGHIRNKNGDGSSESKRYSEIPEIPPIPAQRLKITR